MLRRLVPAVVLVAVLPAFTGCSMLSGVLGALPFPIPGLGGGEPSPSGEEVQMLYAKGVRAMMPDPVKELKIGQTERVWVVNENGGTNSDRPVDALTYDAIVDVLRQKGGITDVVARDDDMMRSLYVEYTESAKLASRDDALARNGKIAPADVILTYRVMRLNARSPGYIIVGLRFIRLEAIDTKTGTTRATRVVEHVEKQPDWFAVDTLFTEWNGK